MAVTRVLYASQNVVIKTSDATEYRLPCQSASADETIPQEDLLVLGKLGAVARVQKDVATCKSTVKAFLVKSSLKAKTIANDLVSATEAGDGLSDIAEMLDKLRADALSGNATNVKLAKTGSTDGFTFDGACSSIGIDVAKGAFPTLDLSFDGVGQVEQMVMGGDSGTAAHAGVGHIHSAVPVTSKDVSVYNSAGALVSTGGASDTIASVKFSLDMPTETLSKIGGVIVGKTSLVSSDNKTFSKPPFKASLTVDGQNLSLAGNTAAPITKVNITDGVNSNAMQIMITSSAAVSTRSFNQNVGDVGASFSVTVEGTDADFAP